MFAGTFQQFLKDSVAGRAGDFLIFQHPDQFRQISGRNADFGNRFTGFVDDPGNTAQHPVGRIFRDNFALTGRDNLFKISRLLNRFDQLSGVFFRQAHLPHKPDRLFVRQLGDRVFQFL